MKIFIFSFLLLSFVLNPVGINAQDVTVVPTVEPTPTNIVVRYGSYCFGNCVTATPTPRPQVVYPPTPTLIPTIAYKPTSTPVIIKRPTLTPTSTPTLIPTTIPTPIPIREQTTQDISVWKKMKLFWTYLINKFANKVEKSGSLENTPTIFLTPSSVQIELTPTPLSTLIPTVKFKPRPTISNKPISVIDENILKTKFGINSPDLIAIILNDIGKLESYEREYYNQLKGWPELKTVSSEQRIFIPSLNSTKICKTANIIEIKNATINVENQKAKTKSVLIKKTMIRPLIRVALATEQQTLDEQLQDFIKERDSLMYKLNELIAKYCR